LLKKYTFFDGWHLILKPLEKNQMIYPNPRLMESFLKALEFAAYRHRFDKSKNEEPYINHIIQVCVLLSTIGEVNDSETLVAAALHDILEKTSTKPNDISLHFGEDVCRLVMELSDQNFENEMERWHQQMEKVRNMSDKSKVIKLADKIANVESVITFPPVGWDIQRRTIYLEWSGKIISALRGTNEKLENYFDELMKAEQASYALRSAG